MNTKPFKCETVINGRVMTFIDKDETNADALECEISWLRDFKSDKAKNLFRLFDAMLYGQAAMYYKTNKF